MRYTDYIAKEPVHWSVNDGLMIDEIYGMIEYKYGGIKWIKCYDVQGWFHMNELSMEMEWPFMIAVCTYKEKSAEEKERIKRDIISITEKTYPSKYGAEVEVYDEVELDTKYAVAFRNHDRDGINKCRAMRCDDFYMYNGSWPVAYPKDMDFEAWLKENMKA